MRIPPIIINTRRKSVPYAFAVAVLLLLATSCGVAERIQQFRQEQRVPRDLEKVWEVYQTVRSDFGGTEQIEVERLTEGAIQGMFEKLGKNQSTMLPAGSYDPNANDLSGIWQAWSIISESLESMDSDITADDLEEAAVHGLLRGLGNPYTKYLDSNRYELEHQDLYSQYEGIGAAVDIADGQLTLTQVFTDSPSDHAGLEIGDVILEANGISLSGLTAAQSVLHIRGPENTPVELLVKRPENPHQQVVTVIRAFVEQPSVDWSEVVIGQDTIVYIKISEFLDNTGEKLESVLHETLAEGYKGIILDLRGNPGGLLNSTVEVASHFLEQGLVMYHIDTHGNKIEFPIVSGGLALQLPLVVLANEFSASGSEVLVGAIQDYDRATVIGRQTFGKGSVNELRKLSDGSGLYLTAALWYTPSGRPIEGVGLKPDVEVFNERLIIRTGANFKFQIVDRQLQVALDHLRNELSVSNSSS